MIVQVLSHKHKAKIACFFAILFYSSILLPAGAAVQGYRVGDARHRAHNAGYRGFFASISASPSPLYGEGRSEGAGYRVAEPAIRYQKSKGGQQEPKDTDPEEDLQTQNRKSQTQIGGPSQPEMASFQSVSSDKLVNLFTGDFNYNIPLLNVGDYPVNIYYTGDITPDQEASWCGLGWNINPGNVNRNTRGVPDDFNGNDILTQVQVMKPNKTWGLGVGADFELMGKKGVVGAEVGVAFNNYLGPSLDMAVRGNASYSIGKAAGSEKFSAGAKVGVGIEVNSRSGTSFTGSVSLLANSKGKENTTTFGIGLSTSYNSRSGIKALQISEQFSFSSNKEKEVVKKRGETTKQYKYGLGGSINQSLYSTSISFVKPSYIPAMRMPLTNTAWAGRFQLGLGAYGVAVDLEAEVYGQTSEVAPEDKTQRKPMVGYLYYQNAVNNPNYVMDFTRYNDREVTPNTPVISVPQYSYDVFSVQGEGTGGTIRAYRNDLGYVRDNITISKDKSLGLGADVDPPGHFGSNFNTVKTPSVIGEWKNGNKLRSSLRFTNASGTFENVYFRNPGENSVVAPERLTQVGGTDLVRFALGGSGQSPTIEPKLQSFNKAGQPNAGYIELSSNAVVPTRNKRTQVTSFLTAEEAAVAGLDKFIKSYNNQTFLDAATNTLAYENIARVDGTVRKAHHLSQINVTESSGKRYVYGIPVYNLVQKDFTFSVDASYSELPDKVKVNANDHSENSDFLRKDSRQDGYVQITSTPAYAHSFLLSGILSPDFVDVTGNGITEDDLGSAVKFNYSRIQSGSSINYKWRTPLTQNDSANFNAGLRSEKKDDKGIIAYGEREAWYLQSVESKTMIALFYVSSRLDGKGATGEAGGINSSDDFTKRLDSIALFSKADLKKNGLAKAKSIKTVHFTYSYQLCQNTPDNPGGTAGNKGKLTLQSIHFSFNGKTKAFKNKYKFSYTADGSNEGNPDYAFAAADRWGTYKHHTLNPAALKNADYPYSVQPNDKSIVDKNAGAWMLKKIVLPTGGQIEINYESDDYAYVQNKRAAVMMPVVGFGSTNAYSAASNRLYSMRPTAIEHDYVFVKVPVACANTAEAYNRYLQGVSQLAFKIWVLMPKGPEYIPCYATFGNTAGIDYGLAAGKSDILWIKMNRLGGKSPLSITTLEYLRQQLPGQAFKGYDVSGEPALKQVADMLEGMLTSLSNAFSDPVDAFRKDAKAMTTDLSKCFIRLNDPDGIKYGGGHRVKTVTLKDNWNAMTGQYTSSYGQQYDYTTTENFNGTTRTISSGVASYEPSIGGEENPWQTIKQIEDYLPLGPTSYGAVEMPVLDAFFPAAVIGYSKVTVRAVNNNTDPAKKSRSGIGRQVTEFYTAKDYPVYYSYTPFDAASVKEFHQNPTLSFFNKYAYDFKAQSQGFLVAVNDMHGKMKAQSSYAEKDTDTRISYTENFYRNTGANGTGDLFTFIGKENKGAAYSGNMGIDVELMTDTREFSVKGTSFDLQGQVDIFYFGPYVIPIPTMWPVNGTAQNIYRAVTTTKVINYHAVLDSIVVIDKGSQVSTKNIAYDAYTGEVLVSRTNNEFDQPVYNTSYPAHWAYSGMGLAYKNIDAVYSNVNFTDGKITSGIPAQEINDVFESGDELYIINSGVAGNACPVPSPADIKLLWAFDKNKPASALTNTSPDLIFMDAGGKLYSRTGVQFKIIRSGRRNLLGTPAATVVSMANPLATGKLFFDAAGKVVNASAVEFKEKWQTDNDVIKRYKLVSNATTCVVEEVPDNNGYLEKSINPYRKGLLGNFRSYRSLVFYDERMEFDTTAGTNIVTNGLLKAFKPYWDFNTANNLTPDIASTQWVWNSKINKVNAKGLELETVDALGIYTAAQYGYNKTMPVAIASNARYAEMFAESFEDYGYGESLSNATFNDGKKHIDFSDNSIISADSAGFKAHTGNKVLRVNGSATISKKLPIGNNLADDFFLNVEKDTTGILSDHGYNVKSLFYNPKSSKPNYRYYNNQPNSQSGEVYVPVNDTVIYMANSPNNSYLVTHNIETSTSHFIQIEQSGNYTISQYIATDLNSNRSCRLEIREAGSNTSKYTVDGSSSANTNKVDAVYLCAGKYELIFSVYENRYETSSEYPSKSYGYTRFSFLINTSSHFYKSLAIQPDCIYTKPIAASEPVLNPVFSVTPNKKMLFSGWVKEDCGNAASGIPCKEYTYTRNQVQLQFAGYTGSNVALTPSGPIIDGWQRYEGEFTAPAGAGSMTVNLVNSGTQPIYFDDIRIHPFNANMKTYVYDPVNLRLNAELDANNYARFYEYDEEGTLIRTKIETREGIKTVSETRSALQKIIQ